MLSQTLQVALGAAPESIRRLKRCGSSDVVAAATSSSVVKIYDLKPDTASHLFTLTLPDGAVTDLGFPSESDPNRLWTCSDNGVLAIWDLRTGAECERYRHATALTALAVCAPRVAVGTEAGTVCFWDDRKGQILAEFEDTHASAITQVAFHPQWQNFFFSASDDGMVSVFHLDDALDEDDSFVAGQNWDSVARFGFFGSEQQRLWCLSPQDGLMLWEWKGATDEASSTGATPYYYQIDIRSHLTTPDPHQVTHCVDCYSVNGGLNLVSGDEEGSVFVHSLPSSGEESALQEDIQFRCRLLGGHSEEICSFLAWDAHTWLTGGADSRICIWKDQPPASSPSRDTSHVMSQPKHKHRLKPY